MLEYACRVRSGAVPMDRILTTIAALDAHLHARGPDKAAREVARHLCECIDRELDGCGKAPDTHDWQNLRCALQEVGLCRRNRLPCEAVDGFVRACRKRVAAETAQSTCLREQSSVARIAVHVDAGTPARLNSWVWPPQGATSRESRPRAAVRLPDEPLR